MLVREKISWLLGFLCHFCKIYPINYSVVFIKFQDYPGPNIKKKGERSKRQGRSFKDLRRNGGENKTRNEDVKSEEEDLQTLFNTEGKLFDFDIKTFMQNDWHEKLSKEMKKWRRSKQIFVMHFTLCCAQR